MQKQEKKALKKQRQAEKKKQGLASVAEEGNDDEEIIFFPKKLQQDIEAAAVAPKRKVTTLDAAAAASVAEATPPSWSPNEEAWIRKKIADRQKTLEATENNGTTLDFEKGTSQGKFRCWACGEHRDKMQDFLLESEDGSWLDATVGGRHWGQCHDCIGGDEREFKKRARESWSLFSAARGDRSARLRDIVFKESIVTVRMLLPNISSTRCRQLAIERLNGLVLTLGAAFARAPREVKEAMKGALASYQADVMEAAQNPHFVPRGGGLSLTRQQCDWLTQVCEGLWVSWQCRRTSCAWHGQNSDWVKHVSRSWYRCPNCGYQYQPWKKAEDLMPDVQKSIIMQHPITGAMITFGCSWPNNEEDSWLQKMVEIRARQLTTPSAAELGAWLLDTALGLDTLLSKVQIPHVWTRYTLQQTTIDMLDARTYPEANYAHIKRDGYTGAILPPSGWAEPFKEWDSLIMLFARSVVGVESKLGRPIL